MLIIPAIDLRNRKVVRLFQGDYEKTKVYGEDPLSYALLFVNEGAKRLHIVDLDGAKAGYPVHRDIIVELAKKISVPIQVGGGIRSLRDIEEYLKQGVSQVILGTRAIESPEFLAEATELYPGKIIVSVDVKGGFVAVSGWLNTTEINYLDFLRELNSFPLFAVIVTIIERDGTCQGVDIDLVRKALEVIEHPLIVAGGVNNLEDIKKLLSIKPFGVITGRALYEGTLKLREALDFVAKHEDLI